MLTFILSAAGMTLVLLLIIAIPLIVNNKRNKDADELPQVNLSIYRDQFKELEDERARGAISQHEFDESRSELERRVLEESVPEQLAESGNSKIGTYTAIGLFLLIPLFAASLWAATQHIGDFRLDGGRNEGVADYTTGQMIRQPGEMHDMNSALEKLKAHLRENPGDLNGWMMLGRSMLTMKNYGEAASAFERANQIAPGNPVVMTDLADAIAMVQGQDLSGRPWELINAVLKKDPTNWKALMMAGSDYFNHGDYRKAVMYWEFLLNNMPSNDGRRDGVIASIQEARHLGNIVGPVKNTLGLGAASEDMENHIPLMSQMTKNGTAPLSQSPVPAKQETTKPIHRISGVVEISEALHEKMGGLDTLYVTARPASGGRMPIAQLKIKVLSFPVHFTLDNTMLPPMDMGGGTLDQHETVMVTARLGKANQTMPANGNFEGSSGQPVKVGDENVKITLDSILAR